MLSVLLGQKNYGAANKVLGNICSLNAIIGILFMAVSLTWLDPILHFFGATENTLPYARDYMEIILYGNVITHLYFGLNGAMRSSGNPRFAMGLTLFTVIFNAILDPIFIFWLHMGVRGAAYATVIAQLAALVIIMMAFSRKNQEVHFEKGIFRLDPKVAIDSFQVGMGPFLMNSVACLVNMFINQQLLKYSGDLGIGAYGIVHRISFLFLMIVMGLNQGMQPIAGYNYGAKLYDRVLKVLNMTVVCACIVMSMCFLTGMLFPRAAVSIFTHDEQLIEMAAHGLSINVIRFLIVGRQMVISNFFQSLGLARRAIFLSLSRQLIFLLPCLIILPIFFGVDGVWYSFPASDLAAVIISEILLANLKKSFKKEAQGNERI